MSAPRSDSRDPREWLRLAGENLVAAGRFVDDDMVTPRIAGFWMQQTAELALKAVLVALALPHPKTHSLGALRRELPTPYSSHFDDLDLGELAALGAAGRYPADLPELTRTRVALALPIAQAVVQRADEMVQRILSEREQP